MNQLLTVLLQRLASGLLTLIIVSVAIFAAVEMLPGGYAEAVLGQSATPETVAAFNEELGLDRPAYVRYFEWIAGVARGDFGTSYSTTNGGVRRSVAEIIGPRIKNTVFLASVTALVAVPLAVMLGIAAALRENRTFDRVISALTLGMTALPEFFVAYVLMIVFSIKLGWFHSLSTVTEATSLPERLQRVALPALTLMLIILAHMMRMTRAAVINLLSSSYVEMARLKGLKPRKVVLTHVLPNACAPIVTVTIFNVAYLITGVVVVEVVFVYPGIGQTMVDAVATRDMPVVQACALLFAATYVVLNLLADIVSILTNPRLLHPR